jgi:hypothetical protein
MDMYETIYGVPVVPVEMESVNGWEIVSMDGSDPINVFSQAVDVSTSKDAGSRFNLAVNGWVLFGGWSSFINTCAQIR